MTVYQLVKHTSRVRDGAPVLHAVNTSLNPTTTICGVPIYAPPTSGAVAATTCKRCRRILFPWRTP